MRSKAARRIKKKQHDVSLSGCASHTAFQAGADVLECEMRTLTCLKSLCSSFRVEEPAWCAGNLRHWLIVPCAAVSNRRSELYTRSYCATTQTSCVVVAANMWELVSSAPDTLVRRQGGSSRPRPPTQAEPHDEYGR